MSFGGLELRFDKESEEDFEYRAYSFAQKKTVS